MTIVLAYSKRNTPALCLWWGLLSNSEDESPDGRGLCLDDPAAAKAARADPDRLVCRTDLGLHLDDIRLPDALCLVVRVAH